MSIMLTCRAVCETLSWLLINVEYLKQLWGVLYLIHSWNRWIRMDKKAGWANHQGQAGNYFFHSLCFSSCLMVPALGFCPDFPLWGNVSWEHNSFPTKLLFTMVFYHNSRNSKTASFRWRWVKLYLWWELMLKYQFNKMIKPQGHFSLYYTYKRHFNGDSFFSSWKQVDSVLHIVQA